MTSNRAGDVVRLMFDTNEFGKPHKISKRRIDISLDAIKVRRRSFTNLSIIFVAEMFINTLLLDAFEGNLLRAYKLIHTNRTALPLRTLVAVGDVE